MDFSKLFPSLTGVIRFLIDIVLYGMTLYKFPSLTGVIRFLIIMSAVCPK